MIRFLTDQSDLYNEWRFVWGGPWAQWTLLLLGILLTLAVVWSWRSARRLSNRKRQWTLFFLRILGAVCIWMLIAGPAIELRHVQKIQNFLPVFLDTSASMRIRTGVKKPSRLQQLKGFFKKNQAFFKRLEREQKVRYFTFDRTVRPLGSSIDTLKANGDQTNLLRVGHSIQEHFADRPLGGVVIASDGLDTLAWSRGGQGAIAKRSSSASRRRKTHRRMRQLLLQLKKLNVPVHFIAPAKKSTLRDIAISNIYGDAFAFLHNTATLEARVRVHGYTRGDLSVTLYREGQILRTKTLRLQEGKTDYLVPFKFRPRKAGQFIYSIKTSVMADEAIIENNQKAFILKIIRDRIRVLQVVGRPGWDVRFMRRLLKKNANIDLISFFIMRTMHNPQLVPQRDISLIPFPSRELFTKSLPSFDLVIFQNFNYGPYLRRSYLRNIARFVRNGGAFMMLGGELSFGAGGYLGTPIERTLPVRLHLGQVHTDWFRPELTAAGAHHPITQLVSSHTTNREIWKSFPKIDGTNLVGDAKQRGTVLLKHPTLKTDSGRPLPILTVGQYGKGRSLALTVDGSWRWNFAHVGKGKTKASYYRFWNNAIRWLIRDPDLKRVRVTSLRSSYRWGEKARFRIRVLDKKYRPKRTGKVRLTITQAPGGKVLYRGVHKLQSNGSHHHQWSPPKSGIYRVKAESELGSKNPISGTTLIEVQGLHNEFQKLRPNERLFAAVQKVTKGQIIRFDDVLEKIAVKPPTIIRIDRSQTVDLWNNIYCLLFFLLIFGVEWGVRRYWGLP